MQSWDISKPDRSICLDCPYTEQYCSFGHKLSHRNTPYNLVFLVEVPEKRASELGQPMGRELTSVIRKITEGMKARYDVSLQYSLLYAVATNVRKAPLSLGVQRCQPYVHARLRDLAARFENSPSFRGTHMVIPFGGASMASLGMKDPKVNKQRGKIFKQNIQGHQYHIVPTLSLRQLFVKSNLVDLVKHDVYTAWEVIIRNFSPDKIEQIAHEYVYPQTISEVKDVCDEILSYTASNQPDANPDTWPIALDTETTGLNHLRPDQRIIAASFAWGDGLATGITLHHRDAPYDPDEAIKHVARVWDSKKPKILHNAKFDYKWGFHVGKLNLRHLWWDTMLGEHYLNEQARGFYKLKELAKKYLRRYTGYEDELQEILNAIIEELESQKLVDYRTAEDHGWWFDDVDHHDMERDVVNLTLQLALIPKDQKNDENTDYLKIKKERTKLWGKVRRAYKKMGWEIPKIPTATKTEFSREDGLYEYAPLDVLLRYAAADTDLTRIVCREQQHAARKDPTHDVHGLRRVMSKLYVPATYSLGRMEHRGILIDRPLAEQYKEELEELIEKHKTKLENLVCWTGEEEFNPASPDHIATVLVNVFGLDYATLPKTEKEQKVSTNKDFLESLRDKHAGEPVGDFCHSLLVFRGAAKAVNNYINAILEMSELDGKVHTHFNLNGTTTGRLSSSKPNFQNLPPWMVQFVYKDKDGNVLDECKGWSIKRLLIPPPGYVLIDCDISAAEIRVLCAYLKYIGHGDDPLIKAVYDGLDVPSFLTAHTFGKEIWHKYSLRNKFLVKESKEDSVKAAFIDKHYKEDYIDYDFVYEYIEANRKHDKKLKEYRDIDKRVLYGTLYGAGPYKIAEQIYGTLSVIPSRREEQLAYAESAQNQLFALSPGIKEYIKLTSKHIEKHQWVDSMFERRRRFPLAIRGGLRKHLHDARREGMNFRIQSTSADMVLSIVCRVEEVIQEELGGEILLTVHDSLMGYVPKESVPKLRAFFDKHIIEYVRTAFPWLPVDFVYGLDIGINYKDTIDYGAYEDPSERKDYDNHILSQLGLLDV